jgi:uncharacterized protein YdhG (YjbR/CyaY superfamily)
MSKTEIDDYLATLEPASQSALRGLRATILDILPEAEQGISYGMAAFKVRGKVIAGFAAFKHDLSYFPHSGSVLPELGNLAARYKTSTGTLQFAVDEALPEALVRELIAARMRQAFSPNPR